MHLCNFLSLSLNKIFISVIQRSKVSRLSQLQFLQTKNYFLIFCLRYLFKNTSSAVRYTVKKVADPVPSRDIKLSLAGNNLITPGQGEFG
jgi:hypothetical protein